MTKTKCEDEEGSFIRINVTETVQNILLFIVPMYFYEQSRTLTANFAAEKIIWHRTTIQQQPYSSQSISGTVVNSIKNFELYNLNLKGT